MATRKAHPPQASGLSAVFTAIEALTSREMGQLAQLLHLQAEDNTPSCPNDFAQLLADAADSFFAADEAA